MTRRFVFGVELEYQACGRYNKDNLPSNYGDSEDSESDVMRMYAEDQMSHAAAEFLESATDGSVNGGEIRHMRPLFLQEAVPAWTQFFLDAKWTIDEECSLHVHLSVENEDMSWNLNLSKWMHYYVIHLSKLMPEELKDRWKKERWMSQYFRIPLHDSDAKTSRYTFVSHRPSKGTWEFRCWGNISDAEGVEYCMRMSADAYKFALLRKFVTCPYTWGQLQQMLQEGIAD